MHTKETLLPPGFSEAEQGTDLPSLDFSTKSDGSPDSQGPVVLGGTES